MAVLVETGDKDSWQTLRICTSIYIFYIPLGHTKEKIGLMKVDLYPKILAKQTYNRFKRLLFYFSALKVAKLVNGLDVGIVLRYILICDY